MTGLLIAVVYLLECRLTDLEALAMVFPKKRKELENVRQLRDEIAARIRVQLPKVPV